MTPRPSLGIAMIICSASLFAVNGTMAKLLQQTGVDAAQVATLRAGGTALALGGAALAVRPRSMRITRREAPMLACYGLAGFFLVPLLYLIAISRMSVGIALLLEYMAPVFVALWARFAQGREVRPRLWVGLALAVGGLACVARVWGRPDLDLVGTAASIAAAVLLAAWFVLGAHGTARRDPLSLTAWAFIVAAIAGAVVRPWWDFPVAHFRESRTLLLTLYVVFLGTTVPYFILTAALRHLPATSVSILSMLEVVIASAVAWVALDEALPPVQLAGGVLILAGVVLAETARRDTPVTTAVT
ncbi:permease [Virgisporangium aliadipatigenens]|uniref:Permease n=1 Tax=Virgisporangium aliadipatigenens TaxID=741659 RepID=A0A8J4DT31_9ACTN|nr:EamA family transporter [Virgisporangium aliadipatigenens]GIJ49870.1 permease [Virgisporangium aliadipatigenens]